MPSSWRKTRSLQVDILTAFVGLLLVTVLMIVGYVYHENAKAVMAVSNALIEQVNQRVIDETTGHLAPASITAGIASRIAGPGAFSAVKDERMSRYALEIVKAYPQLAMANIGDEQGSFLMHKRLEDGTIATKTIDRTVNPPTVTWRYRDASGRIVQTDTSTDVQYDPRVRPWYQGAKQTGGIHWTDIYIFFTDKQPGINASYPIRNAKGEFVGAVGLDIELVEISRFLQALEIGKSGMAFIVNGKDQLVAYPDLAQIVKQEGGSFRPARIDEVGEPWITECFRSHQQTRRAKFQFDTQGKRCIASFTPFQKAFGKNWRMGVVVPEDDFIGALKKANRVTIAISFGVLLIAILSASLLAQSISRPISALAEETKRIREFDLEGKTEITSHIHEIQLMSDAIAAMRTGLQAFGRYVPAGLVRQLIRTGQEARIGGEKRELTILFTDVEGFTTLSEDIDPEELMLHFSDYLDDLTPIIMEQHGTIDKYTGDGIMAFWGAPVRDEDHAEHACRAALLCQRRVQALNAAWKAEGKLPMPTRIGIHTGESIVGNLGSVERMNYSVLGDSVNLASRLEGVNKVYGTRTIVSAATFAKVSDRFLFRPLDIVAVKGKKLGIRIYELVAETGDAEAEAKAPLCRAFGEGFEAYLAQDWEGAQGRFREILEAHPSDGPARLYIERCEAFRRSPPGADWDGIARLDEK